MVLAACLAHFPASVNGARDVEQVRISKASEANMVERPVCTINVDFARAGGSTQLSPLNECLQPMQVSPNKECREELKDV